MKDLEHRMFMFKSYGVEVPGMVSKTNYRLLDITGFLKYSRIMTAWQWRKLCWRWWLVVVVESFFQVETQTQWSAPARDLHSITHSTFHNVCPECHWRRGGSSQKLCLPWSEWILQEEETGRSYRQRGDWEATSGGAAGKEQSLENAKSWERNQEHGD